MDLDTDVTTAARRIARILNGTPKEVTLSFDSQGHQVDGHPTGMSYIDPADEPAYVVKASGCKNARTPMTWRTAQDFLDSNAYARLHPGDDRASLDYLDALASAREAREAEDRV